MKTSVVAIFAATAHGNGISLPSCGHWTPTYPRNQEYNNSASISTEKLNVHLIAHTHDDPGWLRTVDQYYTERVDYILDTVVTELAKNPNRRFMYVEQSFFQRWWREQSEETKHLVKKFVKSGQLDLTANGGWVMHDEATPHYTTMLDQTTFGHKFLLEEFGVRPRIGWQIDPFGHSSTQGSLLSAGIGFDGLYFARMDYQDYDKRLREKNLEFLWKASPSRNETVFTGMIQGGYGAPGGFMFSEDIPIKDDPCLHDNNICDRIKSFVDQRNHIFWPMGSDMEYINALRWFKNLDKLIHYGNQEGRVNILYSTLGEYTDLKLQDKSIEWAVKTDDFFPYANSQNAYWSGYFTSRPALKRYTRVANNLLQSIRHLEVWTKQKFSHVNHLAASVGLVLHHDSLSGTEKQVVADDYAERLADGVTQGHLRLREILSSASLDLCLLTNVSICNATNTLNPFTFIVYNPLPFAATFNVNLPIASSNAKVERSNGTTVSSAVLSAVPVYSKPLAHAAANELIVESLVPPLSWETFHVTPRNAPEHAPAPPSSDAVVLENEFLCARVNSVSGSLESLTDKRSNTTIQVTSKFKYYQSFSREGDGTSSGAYLFHPNTSKVHPLPSVSTHECRQTPIVTSCYFHFGEWATLDYRLHSWDRSLVVEWKVGQIPIDDNQGKEVILRFDTSLKTEKKWYTDSNGLEFVERVRDFRETWNLTLHNEEERVAANYVPITIAAYLRDENTQFNVITDRAQGASSLKDGSLEIMIHRRLLGDDYRGVGESLNETETIEFADKQILNQGLTVRGAMALSIGSLDTAMETLRTEMNQRYLNPLVAVIPHDKTLALSTEQASWEPRLPPNVGLTSLELADRPHCIRLRLSHLFAVNEHSVWSKNAEVDLALLLQNVSSKFQIHELSLTGNRVLREIKGTMIVMKAMHVRAFQVCSTKHAIFDASDAGLDGSAAALSLLNDD